MSTDVPNTPNPYVWFRVFGDIEIPPKVSRVVHKMRSMPGGIELQAMQGSDQAVQMFVDSRGPIGRMLDEQLHDLADDVRTAARMATVVGNLQVNGTVHDTVCDVIGLVQALLDSGGVAVLDAQVAWRSAAQFKAEVFASRAAPRSLVTVFTSQEDSGTLWLHTRGMRLFGRPDLSVRGIDPSDMPFVAKRFLQLIDTCNTSERILEGQRVALTDTLQKWTARHFGSVDDPHFNNVHVAFLPDIQ